MDIQEASATEASLSRATAQTNTHTRRHT